MRGFPGKTSPSNHKLALHDQNIGGGKNTTVLSMPAYLPEPSHQTGCNILCLDCRLDCRLAAQRRRGREEEFSHPESGNVNVEPPARSLTRARITSVMLMTSEQWERWRANGTRKFPTKVLTLLCYLDDATLSAPELPNNTRVTCLLTAKDFPFSMMDRGGKTKPSLCLCVLRQAG